MSIKRYAGDRLTGLSTDTKPLNATSGTLFYESDTHRIWLYGTEWAVWVNNNIPDTTESVYTYADGKISSIVSQIAGNEQIANYTYDLSDRIDTVVISFLGYETTITYTYDETGNILSFTSDTQIQS